MFLGPTLEIDTAREVLPGARFLPPVQLGDLYRAAVLWRPEIIGIVDGFFRQVPAVWHKEILWALERGVRVLGSASMGALRASELDRFGMEGVGRIYEAYRSGALAPYHTTVFEDDDEVAVAHGPVEAGYPSSEALVNIRCTLAAAAEQNIIDETLRDRLAEIAKSIFFADRSYPELVRRARAHRVDRVALDDLLSWLPAGRVDQKRQDALEMLARIAEALAHKEPAPTAEFRLVNTGYWKAAVDSFGLESDARQSVLDELRLRPLQYDSAARAARRRLHGGVDSPEACQSLDDISRSVLDPPTLQEPRAPLGDRELIAVLEARGRWEALVGRAAAKAAVVGPWLAKLRSDSLTERTGMELQAWYFERYLGIEVPDSVAAHAQKYGFSSLERFLRVVLAEYYYLEETGTLRKKQNRRGSWGKSPQSMASDAVGGATDECEITHQDTDRA